MVQPGAEGSTLTGERTVSAPIAGELAGSLSLADERTGSLSLADERIGSPPLAGELAGSAPGRAVGADPSGPAARASPSRAAVWRLTDSVPRPVATAPKVRARAFAALIMRDHTGA